MAVISIKIQAPGYENDKEKGFITLASEAASSNKVNVDDADITNFALRDALIPTKLQTTFRNI